MEPLDLTVQSHAIITTLEISVKTCMIVKSMKSAINISVALVSYDLKWHIFLVDFYSTTEITVSMFLQVSYKNQISWLFLIWYHWYKWFSNETELLKSLSYVNYPGKFIIQVYILYYKELWRSKERLVKPSSYFRAMVDLCQFYKYLW